MNVSESMNISLEVVVASDYLHLIRVKRGNNNSSSTDSNKSVTLP